MFVALLKDTPENKYLREKYGRIVQFKPANSDERSLYVRCQFDSSWRLYVRSRFEIYRNEFTSIAEAEATLL